MKNKIFYLLLLVLIFILYSKSLYFGFSSFDDSEYINDSVKTGLNFKSIFWAFSTFTSGNWIPLTWFSYLIEVTLFGADPFVFHMTNMFIHLFNSILVFILTFQMAETITQKQKTNLDRYWIPVFLSLLFAIHPQRAEAVIWISERKELLCAFFYFLSIIYYLKYDGTSLRFYLFSLLFFILALLSKPMAVSLPLILILVDICKMKETQKQEVRILLHNKIPFFIFSLLISVVSLVAQKSTEAINSNLSLTEKIHTVFTGYLYYLELLFYPANLSIFYTSSGIADSISYELLGGFIILAISILVLQRRNLLMLGWYWFIITLLPVIGIVKVGEQFIADRYTYISHLGIYLMLFYLLNSLWNKKRIFKYMILIMLFFWGTRLFLFTGNYSDKWSSDFSLWDNALKNTKNNFIANYNLGVLFLEKNDLSRAESYLQKCIKINPSMPEAYADLGIISYHNKKYEDSINYYHNAVNLKPTLFEAWFNLSDIYYELNNPEMAVKCLRKCKMLKPYNAVVIKNLSIAEKILMNKN